MASKQFLANVFSLSDSRLTKALDWCVCLSHVQRPQYLYLVVKETNLNIKFLCMTLWNEIIIKILLLLYLVATQ